MPNARRAYDAAKQEAEENGLDTTPKELHAWATYVLALNGYGFPGRPDITSGFRSPGKQRELLQRWIRGDRRGLRERPAERSWHMAESYWGGPAARAWDVQTDVSGFSAYEWLMQYARDNWFPELKIGSEFGDRGHYALPSGERPPSISV